MTLRRSERIELAHGTCVLVELADLDAALLALAADEQAHAMTLGDVRRREFVGGRTAMRLALGRDAAILGDARGAPILPADVVGSISHKGALAAALVAPADVGHIGIDIELAQAPRQDIGRRILTDREAAALPDRGRAVTLRFAIKEAIYKAIDRYLQRYVGFTEVELDVGDDGSVRVTSELPLAIEATWREHAGHWLATARATR